MGVEIPFIGCNVGKVSIYSGRDADQYDCMCRV